MNREEAEKAMQACGTLKALGDLWIKIYRIYSGDDAMCKEFAKRQKELEK